MRRILLVAGGSAGLLAAVVFGPAARHAGPLNPDGPFALPVGSVTKLQAGPLNPDGPKPFSQVLSDVGSWVQAQFQSGRSNEASPAAVPDSALAGIRRYSDTIRKTVAEASATTGGILFASTTFPAVGRLFRVSPGGDVSSCTGTLVSPKHLLTAAHCFCEKADSYFNTAAACLNANAPSSRTSYAYFPAAGLFPVKANTVVINPGYSRSAGAAASHKVADLAIAELSGPVPLEPARPFAAGSVDHYISVGFGLSATASEDANRLGLPNGVYSGGIGTLAFRDLTACPPGIEDLLCGHYKAINFNPTSDSNAVCKGDSGGPLFGVTASHDTRLVGVTSARISLDSGCDPNYEAFSEYTRLESHRAWIESVIATAPAASSVGPDCADAILSSQQDKTTSIEFRVPSKSEIALAVAGVDSATPPSMRLRQGAATMLCRAVLEQRDFFHCSMPANDNRPIGFDITGRGIAQLSICSVP
jgi:hypothetical protein